MASYKEEEEEALCLVGSDGEDSCISLTGLINGQDCSDCMRSSPPQDLFDFTFHGAASASASEMCAADDIFVQGRMLVRNPTPPAPAPTSPLWKSRSHVEGIGRRRWEALDGFDRRLRRAASDSAPAGRTPKPRPRWYWFLFGSVNVPEPVMEMSEIRSRLRRRAAAPEMRDGGRWAAWKLIQSLSCKGVDSAAVTAPAPMMSHGGIMGI